ncbi:MAG: hypothetical protein KDD50_16285, partial [Bdellovibrionales bacterium]|nr:hypothetical protein [Bdellovibrionales bacterium]
MKKINLAEVIKNDLAKVIAYDDGFQIVAALTAFGEVNEDMYKTIIGSKIPDLLLKKGEEERLKQYKEAIAQ